MPYAHITGWGMSAPEGILTNDDISKMVDTNDQWIRERTGIHQRHIAREDQFPSTLAVEAAVKALTVANLRPTDLDLIICATSSPEYIFPATACLVQDQLGASKAGAFDLSAACTGFVYALNMGAQAIRSGSIKSALIIGTETLSRFINWKDRGTCILFGDGAGAFVLQASDQPGGVMSAVMHSDGSGGDLLTIQAGGSRYPATDATIHEGKHFIQMDGNEVFRFATRVMASATKEALDAANLKLEDVRWIIPHQANIRIIQAAARGPQTADGPLHCQPAELWEHFHGFHSHRHGGSHREGSDPEGRQARHGGLWRRPHLGCPGCRMDRADPEQEARQPAAVPPLCPGALLGPPYPALSRGPAVPP